MDKFTVWQNFSNEIGGTLICDSSHDHIEVKVKWLHWDILFDIHPGERTSSSTLTRVRAMFISKDNFLFTLYQQDIFSEIAKFFGMQDIEVGHSDFDSSFVIKSNNANQIKALLKNKELRKILLKYPYVYFDIRKNEGFLSEDFPKGILELYLHEIGVVLDIEELRAFYRLFSETLKELCSIGSAYEKPLLPS
jgi:hypothetical protein